MQAMLEGITPASGPSEWLEKVKVGYGKWFSHAFSLLGFQDIEDLKVGVNNTLVHHHPNIPATCRECARLIH